MTFNQQLRLMREQQQREQNWSARQAERQMRFQREMSDSAHQREMRDLQAAGLNPILTASGGSGASTPSGASADSSSIAALIPQALAVASDAAKAAGHSGKTVINVGAGAGASSASSGLNSAGELQPIIKTDDYNFGNPHVQEIYNQLRDIKFPGTDLTVGKAMISAKEAGDLTFETALQIANAIGYKAETDGNSDFIKLHPDGSTDRMEMNGYRLLKKNANYDYNDWYQKIKGWYGKNLNMYVKDGKTYYVSNDSKKAFNHFLQSVAEAYENKRAPFSRKSNYKRKVG